MNNSIVKLTFYVLVMFLVSDCSAVAAKKQKSNSSNTEELSVQSNDNGQFVQEANERIVDNKIDTYFPYPEEFIKQRYNKIDSKILSVNSLYTFWEIKTSGF